MKNIIKKSCAVLAALTMIVSIASATCTVAFAYDDETTIILPMWEQENGVDEEVSNNIIRP